MHVGERPYIVVGTQTTHISTHDLNLEAMTGMLMQLLPAAEQGQLEEFGAVEHRLPVVGDDRFTVVAARGGDDIWIEIRRRRAAATVPMVPSVPEVPQVVVPEPVALVQPVEPVAPVEPVEPVVLASAPAAQSVIDSFLAEPETVFQTQPEPEVEPVYEMPATIEIEPEPELMPEPVAEVAPTPMADPIPEPIPEPIAEIHPELVAIEEPVLEVIDEPIEEPVLEAIHEPAAEQIAASIPEPQPEPQFVEAPIRAVEPVEPVGRVEPLEPAVVVPMTRTVRIEVPARAVASTRTTTNVERLLRVAAARGASALFLTSDSRPFIRVEGDMRQLESEAVLARADVESAILAIAPEGGDESVDKSEATEWIAEFEDVGRIRCTTFTDHRGPGVLLRMIATRAATAEQLGLSREVQLLATETQGLVLVAGPRGSGKSTLLSGLVDSVNRQRAEFVITLERQIRLVHDNKSALVSQREIRGGADAALAAARLALRESPDVLVVDDLVSPHMVPLLLTAASEGLLVFVSMAAPSTTDAVEKFIEMVAPEMRKSVQAAMSESFRGAVAQVLLKKSGGGQVAAREILLATAPVTRVIGEGQMSQLPLTLESGRKHGMVSFTDALVDFVRTGTVDVREAFRKAPDRERLLESLKRNSIDTSVVERLA